MANIKSAMKRAQLAKAQNLKNAAEKSAIRTTIRRFEKALTAQDKEKASEELTLSIKKLDKSVRRGLFHKKTVARKKSRMTKKLNALG